MRDKLPRDNIFASISWVIVLVLCYAAISMWFAPTYTGGPVGQMLGDIGMKIAYGTVYFSQAVLLAYSKIMQKKKMRKRVLMSIYLFLGFTSILSVSLVGFSVRLIDNIFISVAAAACWLHWTFRTEYVDAASFLDDVDDLRPDPPPK